MKSSIAGVTFLVAIALLDPIVTCDEGEQCPHSACGPPKACKLQDKLTYHQTMTPAWLEGHASYIFPAYRTVADMITFHVVFQQSKAPLMKNPALLKVPLIAADVLKDCVPLTVEITVANDVNIGGKARESNIRYGLSDGSTFVGFEAPPRVRYEKYSPCYGIEGISGKYLSQIDYKSRFPKVNKNSYYPGQFVFTFKLDQRWGSCYTAQDHGFVKTAGYINRLKVSKGLTLEVYMTEKYGMVGIKFIKVAIIQDSSCNQ